MLTIYNEIERMLLTCQRKHVNNAAREAVEDSRNYLPCRLHSAPHTSLPCLVKRKEQARSRGGRTSHSTRPQKQTFV